MAEEPEPGEEVVLATMPQIISSENIVSAGAGVAGVAGAAGVPGAGAARAGGGAAGAELGRRLLLAARAGDAQAVLDLMAQGAPFSTDWLGTSPLHLACAGGHAGAAAVLLRAGVSRDARTKVERTPLHLAAHAGHARVAQLLLDHGALVDCRDMLRMTPLHWACARGHAALAALLVRRGADVRARCKFGRSALRLAAPRPPVRRALRDALRGTLLHDDRAVEEADAAAERKVFQTVQMQVPIEEKPIINNVKILPKIVKPILENKTSRPAERTSIPTAAGAPGAAAAGGAAAGGAAALLRQHGITLLPADDGSTVLSALQSGRTVVLSDAGKLMLKENRAPAPGGAGAAGASAEEAPRAAPALRARAGVVLRATPAREPPRAGVKVFTLNKRPPAPAPAPAAATAVAVAPPAANTLAAQDAQITYVQLPTEATIVSPAAVSAVSGAPGAPGAPGASGVKAKAKLARAGARPGVKIIMNQASFGKLVATAARAHHSGDNEPLTGLTSGGEAVVCVPEQFVRSMSARYLRAQLLAAHAALAALARELRAARAAAAAPATPTTHNNTGTS